MNNQIVILGAGFAGMMAALRLSRKLPKGKATIKLVNASDTFVERTRLHQFATGQHPKTRTIPALLRGTRVQFAQGRATAIQPNQKQLTIETITGVRSLGYDTLIYALGSRTDREHILGLAHAYTLDASEAIKLAEVLPQVAARGGHALIIGGGLTGIEAATEIAESFPSAQVALATQGALGDHLSAPGAVHVRKVFDRLHIRVHDGAAITRIDEHEAVTASGERLPFDVCINCTGNVPPALARVAGLAVNDMGQLVMDAFMRSVSHPEVYGAGDAAAFEDGAHMPMRMACATAMPMAVQAADNLVAYLTGRKLQPFGYNYVPRCISLGRHDGLLQLVDSHDAMQPRIITGRMAVAMKEGILRLVASSLDAEKRFSLYRSQRTQVAQTSTQAQAAAVSFRNA